MTAAKPKVGRPHVSHSLLCRFRQFFVANPDEELTYLDASIKFDCTVRQAQAAAQYLVKHEALESVHVVRAKQVGIAS
jgi:hypothetical protein